MSVGGGNTFPFVRMQTESSARRGAMGHFYVLGTGEK